MALARGVMAKESVWQRRARKHRSGKAEYYPKVAVPEAWGAVQDAPPQVLDLTDAAFEEASAPIGDVAEVTTLDAVDPPDADSLLAVEPAEDALVLDLPEAAPLAATHTSDEAEASSRPMDGLEFSEAAPAPAATAPSGTLRLPEFLDLPAATPLARALLERRGQPIVIDGSSVHQLGAQCVQVLLSAKRTWGADGVPLSIVKCAPRMIEDLQYLGINSTTLMSGEQSQ